VHLDERKYITLKRSDVPDDLVGRLESLELSDAVVIRRKDLIAAPALAAYASLIGVAATVLPKGHRQREMYAISDYFHQQAELALEEGSRLPSL
jgi:hypothetical protein